MNLQSQVQEMDALVTQGEIVKAVELYFAAEASTSDYGNVTTGNRAQMVDKMKGFLGGIAKVNGITHHHTIVGDGVSASEFTFDFDMKDGSKIYWHEIIRRVWNSEGKVVQEEYFNAQA